MFILHHARCAARSILKVLEFSFEQEIIGLRYLEIILKDKSYPNSINLCFLNHLTNHVSRFGYI